MNSDKPEGKKRPVLLVPRCETCCHSDAKVVTAQSKPIVTLYCSKWQNYVPMWGFCHEHPEVIAHA